MPNIHKVVTVHQGFTGAPGYTNMFFDSAGTAQSHSDAVHTFWETVAPYMASVWTYSIQADVNEYVDSTGHLVSVNATTPLAQSVVGGTAGYASGAGAVVGWITNSVHFTKRLRGRTFLVPLESAAYDAGGTLTTVARTAFQNAANTLNANTDFGVWGRPVAHLNGLFALTAATAVADKVAWLSSRRD